MATPELTVVNENYRMSFGAPLTAVIAANDLNGDPVDLTGGTMTFFVGAQNAANMANRIMTELFDQAHPAVTLGDGTLTIALDGASGDHLPQGVYPFAITAADATGTEKLLAQGVLTVGANNSLQVPLVLA